MDEPKKYYNEKNYDKKYNHNFTIYLFFHLV